MPAGLGAIGRAWWRKHVGLLEASRVLTHGDATILELGARTYELLRRASAELERDGLIAVFRDDKGAVKWAAPHPAIGIAHKASGQLRAVLCELGLTPAARSKVQTAPDAKTPAPSWRELLMRDGQREA
jgi:P27 family predicted phage terminase small subunit